MFSRNERTHSGYGGSISSPPRPGKTEGSPASAMMREKKIYKVPQPPSYQASVNRLPYNQGLATT